jgi:hypothetical protein
MCRKLKYFLAVMIIFVSCGYAHSLSSGTKVYVDPVGGNDSWDGLAPSFVSGSNGPWKSCTPVNNIKGYVGDTDLGVDVYIYAGTTLNCSMNSHWSGTASDLSEISSYDRGIGGLAKPIINGMSTQAGPWTRYAATAIYSADNTSTSQRKIVTVDGSRLMYIVWKTDIATTAANMTAGTYTHDVTGQKLYVWTSDSADPSGKTVQYSSISTGIDIGGWGGTSHWDYKWVHGLSFYGHNGYNLEMGEYYGGYLSDNSVVEDNDFSTCGSNCFRGGGDNFILRNNTCTDSGTEGQTDVSCLSLDGGNAGVDDSESGGTHIGHTITGAQEYGNYVHDTRNGSCYEVDFGVDRSYFHHNTGNNCTNQFLEVWTSNNNSVYSNRSNVTGYPACASANGYSKYDARKCRVFQGIGIKITNNSDQNTLFNNELIGFPASGIYTGSENYCGNTNNKFYHNILVNVDADAAFVGLGNSAYCPNDTGNVWKNNIVKTTNGKALQVYAPEQTFDYNDYSVGATFGTYLGATKTFAGWQALGQDAHSITSDPVFTDQAIYNLRPTQLSPTINAGVNLPEVTNDYDGNPRIGITDIGAFESQWQIKSNGAKLKGLRTK